MQGASSPFILPLIMGASMFSLVFRGLGGDAVVADLLTDLPGGKITIEHGHTHGAHQPCHDSLRKAHADAKVIIYGHTHKQVIDKSNNPWVVNPGAAGNTRS